MSDPALCTSCGRPIGLTTFVIQGYLGTYYECEWCFDGKPRPAEPELITDTFTEAPPRPPYGAASPARLDAILDKLTGE